MIGPNSHRKFIAASLLSLAAGGVLAAHLSAGELHRSGRGRGPGMLGRMARFLDLTESQKAQIRDVYQAHSVELQAQREARRAAHRALADAAAAEPVNESAVRSRAAEVGRVAAEGALLSSRIRSEIAPLLTTEQREKLKDMRTRFHGRKGAPAS